MNRLILLAALCSVMAGPLVAQQPNRMTPGPMRMAPGMCLQPNARCFDKLEVASPEHVAGTVYRLVGGIIVNMAFSLGDDGIILVDSNFGQLTEKILAAIREVSQQPIRFLVDTHAHGDHTNGNANFARTGAVIVAHESLPARLAAPHLGPPAVGNALPVVTFSERVTFHFNGEEVEVFHVTPAHTDGDVLVYFKQSDVIHMGDILVGHYPLIDSNSGGNYLGLIETLNAAIGLIGPETKVIPGHGPIADRGALIEFRDLVQDIYNRVGTLAEEGKTLEQVIAARPTADYDKKWAGPRGSKQIVTAAYKAITQQ